MCQLPYINDCSAFRESAAAKLWFEGSLETKKKWQHQRQHGCDKACKQIMPVSGMNEHCHVSSATNKAGCMLTRGGVCTFHLSSKVAA